LAGHPYLWGGCVELHATSLPHLSNNHNTWVHYAISFDGTTSTIYMNGVPQSGSTFMNTPASRLFVGAVSSIGTGPNFGATLDGLMDEVRIYDFAMTQAEITAEMNLQYLANPNSTTGLVAYYDFNGTGTVVPDLSNNGNDLDIINSASLVAAPAGTPTGAAPIIPTMGEWSLMIFGLIVLSLGIVYVMRWKGKYVATVA